MKSLIKNIAAFIAKLIIMPAYIFYKLHGFFIKNERFFCTLSQAVSLIPGTFGNYIRLEFYKLTLKKCSKDCYIGFGTLITHRDVDIGENVFIGAKCMIGMASIGDDTLIGSNVDILSGKRQHGFQSLDLPIRQQEHIFEQVHIGSNCWIGNSAVIMSNIAEGCIIGAGSVVSYEIDAYSIAVGNPAKVVKKRT